MAALAGKGIVDHLLFLLQGSTFLNNWGGDTCQLLGVQVFPSGTGAANAVCQDMTEWLIQGRIVGMVFNMIAMNTKCQGGECTLLEQQLD